MLEAETLARYAHQIPPRKLREAAAANTTEEQLCQWLAALRIEPRPTAIPSSVTVLGLSNDRYPAWLAGGPVLLWVRGDLAALAPGIAAIGTRRPSGVGLRAARAAARAAAEVGAPLISGHAAGCDRAAELAAVQAGVRVASVVAGGVNDVDDDLVNQIIAGGGAIVSEHPNGHRAGPQDLMARNRIIVGLASVVVVCEGDERSGTAKATEMAVNAGRFVCAPRQEVGLLKHLTSMAGADPKALRWGATASERAWRDVPLANAVATTPGELADCAVLGWKLCHDIHTETGTSV